MAWTFQIVDDWEEVWSEAHLARWQHHMDAADGAHVFFHPALVRAWVDTYRPLRCLQPLFVWAKHEKGMTAILPLTLWRRNWKNAFMKSIVPMGYSDFDYHDPVFSQQPMREDVQGFWAELRAHLCRLFSFDELCLDGLHEAYLPAEVEVVGNEPCPYIDICGMSGVDDYLATRNKKMRYNLRRQHKKAESQFLLSYTTFTERNVQEALDELPSMLEYHRQRWPKAYKAPHFHENLLRHGLSGGILHFSRLGFGEQAASWRIGFCFNGRYYSYMPTLNPHLLEYGAGKMHLLHCISYAIEHKLSVYDQLRGAELYKSEWTEKDDSIYHLRWNRRTLIGAGKRCLLAIRNKIFK